MLWRGEVGRSPWGHSSRELESSFTQENGFGKIMAIGEKKIGSSNLESTMNFDRIGWETNVAEKKSSN